MGRLLSPVAINRGPWSRTGDVRNGRKSQNRRSSKGGPAVSFGAPVGIRTPNLLIRSQMLYPLSYRRPPPTGVSDWTRIADPPSDAEIRVTLRHRSRAPGLGLEKAEDMPLEVRLSRSKQGM